MARTEEEQYKPGFLLANNFLQALYGNESMGWLTLWTSEDKETHWYKVQDVEKAAKHAMKLSGSKNVYFGLGLRKENLGKYKRGKNLDIISLPCVWVEIDVKGGIHAADNLPTMEEVQSFLNRFPIEPSIINHSGGGLHCYWLLDQPARINNHENIKSAERMLSRFQAVFINLANTMGLKIDNTSDLARVLRIPGTFNRKGEPRQVKTVFYNPENKYSLTVIKESIERMESQFPNESVQPRENHEYEGEISDAKYVDRIVNGCNFIRDYLENKELATYDEWMTALSIASYCEGGHDLVHEWSFGHPGYNEQDVDQKYQQIRENLKPRTCHRINQDFHKCGACPHFNMINSPIALGMEKKESSEKKSFKRTDLGNAERLIYRHGKNLRFNSVSKSWYIWDGKRWKEDKVNKILQLAKETVRSIYKEAYLAEDEDSRKALSEHARYSENATRIRSMVSLAESEVPILPEEMDADKWLFNCQNGVIDLKTGELKPHGRGYFMTKISPIAYDLEAKCPTWDKFLEDIMQDKDGNVKHELIEFLQKVVGYSLTGDTSEQKLFMLYGGGRNGKSTFMNSIKIIFGEYGNQTNAETFTVKKNDRINNDIAALKGARLVVATESEEGARLAESLIKQLTGGEPISARFLHQEFFEFLPQFKIFFITNHIPVIRGSDEAIWRRISLVPFWVYIPDEKLDKDLPNKLKAELPGILRWAIEGCLKWIKEGLGNPKEVQDATAGYRDEMDTLGSFLDEYCIVNENAKCPAPSLYQKYTEWTEVNGEFLTTRTKFYRRIEERGIRKQKSTGGQQFFFGIGLKELNLVTNSPFNSGKVVMSGEKSIKSEMSIKDQNKAKKTPPRSTFPPGDEVEPEYL